MPVVLGAAEQPQPTVPASAAEPSARKKLSETLIREFAGERCMTRPSSDAIMGFSLPTQVAEIAVKAGQEVKLGQLLIRGDDAEEQALFKLQRVRSETDVPVQRAKAAMDQAKVEYDRFQDVVKKDGASVFELERSRLAYETARLDWETARMQQTQEVLQMDRLIARLKRYRLDAPFDCQVDTVNVDVGQAVSENEKVIRVVNVDPLWIDVGASTEDPRTLSLNPGDQAWILLDVAGSARLVSGKVTEVAPTASIGSRSRRVRVEMANPKGPDRILAGDPAWVRFSAPPQTLIEKIAATPVAAK